MYSLSPATFLDKSAFAQREEWRTKFKEIQTGYTRSREKHFFLAAHLLYRYGQIPSVTADLRELADWKPDCIITLIDDIYAVRQRIHVDEYTAFELQELLLWRAEELLLGDVLSRLVNNKNPPPNYLISVRHPVRKLAHLIFSHNKKNGEDNRQPHGRVYLSFNISDTRNTEQGRKEINDFRRQFHSRESLFVFDPLMIDELPPIHHLKKLIDSGTVPSKEIEYDPRDPRWHWPWLIGGDNLAPIVNDSDLLPSYPLKLPTHELAAAASAIDAQVSNRDLRLVDQAHYLALWRPTMTRGTQVSAGVRGEMEFARQRGVHILAYLRKGEDKLTTSSFTNYLNPQHNPNVIFAKTAEKFWQRVDTLQQSNHEARRNDFLR